LTHSGQNEELEQDLPLEKMKLNPRESKLVAVARDWTEKKQREILTEEESERPNSALFLAETSEQIRAEGVKPVGHDRIQGDGPKSAWAEAKRTSDSLRRRKRWQPSRGSDPVACTAAPTRTGAENEKGHGAWIQNPKRETETSALLGAQLQKKSKAGV
jgi:kynurenine formamidase